MNKRKKKLKGFSLAELILAIAVFASASSMLVYLVIDSTRTLENIYTRASATQLVEEVYNSIVILKEDAWFNIARYTGEGEKYIQFNSGTYEVLDGRGSREDMTYYFTVDNVMRDTLRNIVTEGGTLDPHTRLITINVSWSDRLNASHTVTSKIYMNDWNTNSIVYTLKGDFTQGTHDQTVAVELTDGELRLQKRFYSDWCKPELSLSTDLSEYDIPGSATPRSVYAQLGYAYLGTRGEATGEPFTKLTIEGVEPPIVSVEGYFSGYNVNDIFIKDNYAFLATTDDNKEVVILDTSSLPYTEIGYFNGPGSDDAYTVFVDGNVGYVGQMENIHSFNLSSYTGARTKIGSIRASSWLFAGVARVSQIKVLNGYLYAVLDWDWYELAIIMVNDPANMSITSQTSVNNQQVYDMYLSEDGTRAYFGTSNSSSEKEFFIIDTSSKSGTRPIIKSMDIPSLTIRGISIVQEESKKYAIIVGTGGQEYQVYNITTETSPIKCGGMEINSGIYDIDSIRDSYTNAFSYIITGDISKEFKIIRGGPGGGGEDGYAFYDKGTYISVPYNSESPSSEYYIMAIKTVIPTATTIQIQVRASNNADMSGSTWIGPDGTESTYFDVTGVYDLPIGIVGQYFQYKVAYTSTSIEDSALLEELIINYEK
jgi:type II secretory pathway pseudopilin PulG